jgi:hypothetical protein
LKEIVPAVAVTRDEEFHLRKAMFTAFPTVKTERDGGRAESIVPG